MTLLQEVDTIEQETIKPLDDCQKLIEHGVNTAADLVQEGGESRKPVKRSTFRLTLLVSQGSRRLPAICGVLRLFVPWDSL